MVETLSFINGQGRLTEEDQPLTLSAAKTPDLDLYLHITKLRISDYKESSDGGVLELRDTNGNTFWEVNTDTLKELDRDFGIGILLGEESNLGVDIITHGSGEPARCWVFVEGYYERKY